MTAHPGPCPSFIIGATARLCGRHVAHTVSHPPLRVFAQAQCTATLEA